MGYEGRGEDSEVFSADGWVPKVNFTGAHGYTLGFGGNYTSASIVAGASGFVPTGNSTETGASMIVPHTVTMSHIIPKDGTITAIGFSKVLPVSATFVLFLDGFVVATFIASGISGAVEGLDIPVSQLQGLSIVGGDDPTNHTNFDVYIS